MKTDIERKLDAIETLINAGAIDPLGNSEERTMMLLLDRVAILERQADAAYDTGAVTEGEALDRQVAALLQENEQRRERAKARLAEFSEEIQASACLNADDTPTDAAGGKPFFRDHAHAQYACEYWEMAAASAEALRDLS